MSEKNNTLTLKILTLGNSAVGKSSLLLRFCRNIFSTSYQSTIGVDFYLKKTEIEGHPVKLSLWDTAGQEKFKVIVSKYYKGADGFLVTYSVDDRHSFEQISYWIGCILNDCDNKQVQMVLIGNKSDTNKRAVTEAEGVELAKQFNIPFFETSALQNINCEEAVNKLSLLCFKKAQEAGRLINNNKDTVLLTSQFKDENTKEKKKNCC